MELEKVGHLLMMRRLITRAVACWNRWGEEAEIHVDASALPPSLADIVSPIGQMRVVAFFELLEKEYAEELEAVKALAVMTRRNDEESACPWQGRPGEGGSTGGRSHEGVVA